MSYHAAPLNSVQPFTVFNEHNRYFFQIQQSSDHLYSIAACVSRYVESTELGSRLLGEVPVGKQWVHGKVFQNVIAQDLDQKNFPIKPDSYDVVAINSTQSSEKLKIL